MELAASRLGACLLVLAWLASAAGSAQATVAASHDSCTTERCLAWRQSAVAPILLQVDQRRSLTLGTGDGFEPVDGGADRACRGRDANDRQNGYMSVLPLIPDLEACKARCRDTYGCRGVEWGSALQRCEVWTRPQGITASAKAPGYTCLRYTPSFRFEWSPADGGEGRACRGRDADDNAQGYYHLYEGNSVAEGYVKSLEVCQQKCVRTIGCKGVEYNAGHGRCEVWVRALGIGATKEKTGYTCLRYGPGTTPAPARHFGEVKLTLCEWTQPIGPVHRRRRAWNRKYVYHAGSTGSFDLSFPSNPVALSYTVPGGGSGPGSTLKLSVEIDGGFPSSIALRASGSDGLCLQSISIDGVQAQGRLPLFLDSPCIDPAWVYGDHPSHYEGIPCSTAEVWHLEPAAR